MPRCKKMRKCRGLSNEKVFKPMGIPAFELNEVKLDLDEFEAMRLCDHESKNQIEASEEMHVSRATVQRLLQSGRHKVVDAFLHNKIIVIAHELDLRNNKSPTKEE